ncbi:hypothetical protein L7F22_040167 [Adiantum nelumboides]|nr:hypothetical protein [Adiantum nelumboides]
MTAILDQDFLFDVSEEDDSLLPLGDKVTQSKLDDSLLSGTCSSSGGPALNECNSKSIEPAQELQVSHTVSLTDEQANLALPIMSEDPNVAKKKTKKGFNVRKSMAWNNAFLSEEGVLDCEELSLVNKTFMKASRPFKQTNSKKLTPTMVPKPTLMPKISLGPNRVVLNATSKEHLSYPASSSFQGNTETLFEPHPTDITGHQGGKSNANSSLSKGALVGGKKEIVNISACANLCESKPPLSKRSPDKNDQGVLLQAPNLSTSKSGTQVKHGVSGGRSVGRMEDSRPTFTKLTMERLSSTSALEAQPRTGSLKLQSDFSSLKNHSASNKSSPLEASGAFTSRDKPSGLRKPSPKLGFFDTSRTASQVAVLRERTNGHGFGASGAGTNKADQLNAGNNGPRSSRNWSEHSASSAKIGHQLLEAPRHENRGIKDCTRIPVAPQVRGRNAEFAPLQLAPAYESQRPGSNLLNTADSTKHFLYARKMGNSAIRGKLATSKGKGQENLSPDHDEGTGLPQKCTLALDLAVRNYPIQSHPFRANGQENLSANFKEGMGVPQKCQSLSLENPMIKAGGDVCTAEVERVCESQASPVKQ